MSRKAKHELFCSFCGKGRHEVKKMLSGPCVWICDECIQILNAVLSDSGVPEAEVSLDFNIDAVPALHTCLRATERAIEAVVRKEDGARRALRTQAQELASRIVSLRRASIRIVEPE